MKLEIFGKRKNECEVPDNQPYFQEGFEDAPQKRFNHICRLEGSLKFNCSTCKIAEDHLGVLARQANYSEIHRSSYGNLMEISFTSHDGISHTVRVERGELTHTKMLPAKELKKIITKLF